MILCHLGHQLYAVLEVLGQFHAVGITSLERDWANSKRSVAWL